jgi:hypothetical protein
MVWYKCVHVKYAIWCAWQLLLSLLSIVDAQLRASWAHALFERQQYFGRNILAQQTMLAYIARGVDELYVLSSSFENHSGWLGRVGFGVLLPELP